MTDNVLTLDSLALTVADQRVFSNLNLTLAAGQSAVIEGANLAGKSSLLRAMRREAPEVLRLTGKLRFRGTDVLQLSDGGYRDQFLRHVGFVDECAGDRLIPPLRVRELFRGATKLNKQQLLALLSSLGLTDPERLLRQRVAQLSRGTRLAVAIALELGRQPSLLFIDNVFFLLDPLSTRQWLTQVRQLQRTAGMAVVALACSPDDAAELEPARVIRLAGSVRLTLPRLAPHDATAEAQPRTAVESVGKPLLRVEYVSSVRLKDVGWRSRPEPVVALDSLKLDLWRGELLALVGQSPSGKTTLAHILARILSPTLGRVALRARDEQQGRSRRLVLCFEDAPDSFDPRLTIRQQLDEALPLRPRGQRPARSGEALLSSVGLDPGVCERYPHQLSAAEAQLVALARARLIEPAVLVLDNALSAVDRAHRDALLSQLREEFAARHAGILWLSHTLGAVTQHADRVGVLYKGRLVELGPSQEVRSMARHPYTRALFSSHQRTKRTLQLVSEGEHPASGPTLGGCIYFSRCQRAEPGHCDTQEPSLRASTSAKHLVACWHPHE